MALQEIDLKSLKLGANFVATRAWYSGGPIVLVSTLNGNGSEYRSRLDTEKSMFIDPLPYEISENSIGRLVAALRNAERARRS